MNGTEYDKWEIFLEQRGRGPSWYWPLNFAVVLHLAVFSGAAVLPDLVERRPLLFNDIVTVNLIDMPEPAPAASVESESAVEPKVTAAHEQKPILKEEEPVVETTEPAVEPEKAVTPDPVPESKASLVPEPTVAPIPEPVPAEPAAEKVQSAPLISLNPVKRKITVVKDIKDIKMAEERAKALEAEKKAEEARLTEVKKQKEKAAEAEKKRVAEKKKKALEEKKVEEARLAEVKKRAAQKALAEAKRMEHEAEQAQRAAVEAREKLASVRKNAAAIDSTLSGSGAGGTGSGGGPASPAALRQYTTLLNGRISTHWKLPEMVPANRKLKTLVVLTVRRDGSVEDMKIERKSGDLLFDQSVMKALQSAEPLPDFPISINESALEFALNFTPQGLSL